MSHTERVSRGHNCSTRSGVTMYSSKSAPWMCISAACVPRSNRPGKTAASKPCAVRATAFAPERSTMCLVRTSPGPARSDSRFRKRLSGRHGMPPALIQTLALTVVGAIPALVLGFLVGPAWGWGLLALFLFLQLLNALRYFLRLSSAGRAIRSRRRNSKGPAPGTKSFPASIATKGTAPRHRAPRQRSDDGRGRRPGHRRWHHHARRR